MEVNHENSVKNLNKSCMGCDGEQKRDIKSNWESLVSSQRPQCLVLKDKQDK